MEKIIEEFSDEFNAHTKRLFLKRLNLKSQNIEEDGNLLAAFFKFLDGSPALFEQTFFDLYGGAHSQRIQNSPQKENYQGEDFENLVMALKPFKIDMPSKMLHPYFKNEKPCTLLIEEKEQIWHPIADSDNWAQFNQKISTIRSFRGIYS